MATHPHKTQYAQLVATFALVAIGLLEVVTLKYQQHVQAAVSDIRNRPSAAVTMTAEDLRLRRAAGIQREPVSRATAAALRGTAAFRSRSANRIGR